jgi:hypothetical protein
MLTIVVWLQSYHRLTLKIISEMECKMGRHICVLHIWATALYGINSTTRRIALQLDVTLAFSIRSWTSRHRRRQRGVVRRLSMVGVYDATHRFLRLWTFLLLEDLLDGQL